MLCPQVLDHMTSVLILLMWCTTFTDLYKINHVCIPEVNLTCTFQRAIDFGLRAFSGVLFHQCSSKILAQNLFL